MTKVRFHPIIEWFTGKMGNMIFRRSHNGKVSVYAAPFMKQVKWSQAQKDHRQRMSEASKYASAAVANPELRPIYIQMAEANNMNKDRPFDMAVKDYYHTGNDLLWKKHMGEKEKPKNWDIEHYSWYLTKRKPRYFNKRKRRR
jgi:hypothetical protein